MEGSTDYHDYVIKDGRLIGDFEGMYRHSSEVPWHQDQQTNAIDLKMTIAMLKGLGPFDEIHDIGCGFGYYLDLLQKQIPAAGFGYDVSETACKKAGELFPQSRFSVLDITRDALTAQGQARRLVSLRATLWYVFPHMEAVTRNLRASVGPNDILLISQNFPPLDKAFVGKEVIPDHLALVRHFGSFRCLRHCWYDDSLKTTNDNWFVGLFS
jgi:SAM-dependent methyltransferase